MESHLCCFVDSEKFPPPLLPLTLTHNSLATSHRCTCSSVNMVAVKKVLYKRFAEVGRVVLIQFGPNVGKLATIIDIVDQNRVSPPLRLGRLRSLPRCVVGRAILVATTRLICGALASAEWGQKEWDSKRRPTPRPTPRALI